MQGVEHEHHFPAIFTLVLAKALSSIGTEKEGNKRTTKGEVGGVGSSQLLPLLVNMSSKKLNHHQNCSSSSCCHACHERTTKHPKPSRSSCRLSRRGRRGSRSSTSFCRCCPSGTASTTTTTTTTSSSWYSIGSCSIFLFSSRPRCQRYNRSPSFVQGLCGFVLLIELGPIAFCNGQDAGGDIDFTHCVDETLACFDVCFTDFYGVPSVPIGVKLAAERCKAAAEGGGGGGYSQHLNDLVK